MKDGCFVKHPLEVGCLGFQVHVEMIHLFSIYLLEPNLRPSDLKACAAPCCGWAGRQGDDQTLSRPWQRRTQQMLRAFDGLIWRVILVDGPLVLVDRPVFSACWSLCLTFVAAIYIGIWPSLDLHWRRKEHFLSENLFVYRSQHLFGHSLLRDILRIPTAGAKCMGFLEQQVSKRRRTIEDCSLVGWICSRRRA